MRILAFADVHAEEQFLDALRIFLDKEKSGNRKIDCVLIGGDLTDFGPVSFAEDLLNLFRKHSIPVFGVSGNVDPKEVDCILIEKGMSVNKSVKMFGGLKIAGIGGSLPTPYTAQNIITEDEVAAALQKIDTESEIDTRTILVTHFPPYGYFDEVQKGGSRTDSIHAGSKELLKVIKEKSPLLSVSAHVHERHGFTTLGGSTIVKVIPAKQLNVTIITIENSTDAQGVIMPRVTDVNFVNLKPLLLGI